MICFFKSIKVIQWEKDNLRYGGKITGYQYGKGMSSNISDTKYYSKWA